MYVYQAIRRPKENPDIDGIRVIREVGYSRFTEQEIINKLKAKISTIPGVWRIYRSVNTRDEVKSKLELIDTLTRQLVLPNSVSNKDPESLWKDILMQPHNKAERLFLLDIDSKDEFVIKTIFINALINIHQVAETPNGFHMICDPFDPKLIESFQETVSIKKDALVYIQTITVPILT
jgi:hypothetical protein